MLSGSCWLLTNGLQHATFSSEPGGTGRWSLKFAYEDLGDEQFEHLVLFLCQHLLGIGVHGFATGPDGGRDAKFIGTAELHPSKAAPWVGTAIIQAKHTNGYNRSFSDKDFFSPDSSSTVIAKEIPRIKKLRSSGELDHYMLFANRRLPAMTAQKIMSHIASECDIPLASIDLFGTERIELLMKSFPSVAQKAGINPVDYPLIVGPDELAEIVLALEDQKEVFEEVIDDPPQPRVHYATKNEINNMKAEYAAHQSRRFLKHTGQLKQFLEAPENEELLRIYETVVDEFQLKIISKRQNYQYFDEIMEYLAELLFNRDQVLSRNKRLTRLFLFYMYWNCDIGENEHAATD